MNATAKIIYGRTAYEGFAKAIGATLGLNVTVVNGASACIDKGGTIHLPGMTTYQTADEFSVTCGVIVHELAHQFYGSHGLIDPARDRLEHDCLNAVLDVADETWVDAWFTRLGNGRPGELLAACNADAFYKNARGPFRDWNNAATHAWKVLCVGILSARKVRGINRWKRYTAAKAMSAANVDAKACFRLLHKAKLGKGKSPQPSTKRFRKLRQLAKQLADLLKPFLPPTGEAANPLAEALAAGSDTVPAGHREATDQEGSDLAEGPVAAGAAPVVVQARSYEFDADAYELLAPAVNRVAQRIAIDGDGVDSVDGLASGPRLGHAHRLVTDGQCLARWDTSDHADGVAVSVVLDCSGSMASLLPEVAGIARAFAQGMRQAGQVQTLAFGSTVTPTDDFARVHNMGGTHTDLAIREAAKWLSQPGQRWIVLITDGCPDNPIGTADACTEAAAQGIRILAIGLRCQIEMPVATIVTANDAAHLAIELDAAARQIEQAA